MSNYAERLAYWFLRLNGFFLVENYVIDSSHSRAEHDLLAVRLPYAEETIRGAKVEPYDLFRERGKLGAYRDVILGLVVQVKGGRPSAGGAQHPGPAFDEGRMRHALKRIGATCDEKILEEAIDVLCAKARSKPVYRGDGFAFAKVLIAARPPERPRSYCSVPLDDVKEYVRKRMRASAQKESHWHYFKDPLLQYIILDEGRC